MFEKLAQFLISTRTYDNPNVPVLESATPSDALRALHGHKPNGRKYTGANIGRLTHSLSNGTRPADADIKAGIKILRARSRDLARNNDYVKQFLRLLKNNVVGSNGIRLQGQIKDQDGTNDKNANIAIEQGWKHFCKKGVPDTSGTKSMWDMQREFIGNAATDGEVLYRIHRRWSQNRFGIAVEFIDPELLDVNLNKRIDENRQIVMGVELNKWRQPIAYHFIAHKDKTQDAYTSGGITRTRLSADEVHHCFIAEFVNQTRAVPWTSSAMLRLNMLDGYEEAELIAARQAAASMGFIETDPEHAGDQYDGGEQQADGSYLEDAEPGSFRKLAPGESLSTWDPDHPNGAYKEYVKTVLRGISSGLGISYNTLSNDLEGVNFSSLRSGVIEMRDTWKELQNWSIENFAQPIFEAWLQMAFLNQQILINGRPVSFGPEKLTKFSNIRWQARRWNWVDPLKDSQANKSDVEMAFRTRSSVIREAGDDPETVFEEYADEIKMLKALGIEVNPSSSVVITENISE